MLALLQLQISMLTWENAVEWCDKERLSLFWLREVQDQSIIVKEAMSKFGLALAPTKVMKPAG